MAHTQNCTKLHRDSYPLPSELQRRPIYVDRAQANDDVATPRSPPHQNARPRHDNSGECFSSSTSITSPVTSGNKPIRSRGDFITSCGVGSDKPSRKRGRQPRHYPTAPALLRHLSTFGRLWKMSGTTPPPASWISAPQKPGICMFCIPWCL